MLWGMDGAVASQGETDQAPHAGEESHRPEHVPSDVPRPEQESASRLGREAVCTRPPSFLLLGPQIWLHPALVIATCPKVGINLLLISYKSRLFHKVTDYLTSNRQGLQFQFTSAVLRGYCGCLPAQYFQWLLTPPPLSSKYLLPHLVTGHS